MAGALVLLRSSSGRERQTVTAGDGRFALPSFAPEASELVVRVSGFAEFRQPIADAASATSLDVVVIPASPREEVTVAGTRIAQQASNVPQAVTVLSQAEVRTSPAIVADDVLRQVPTFSLFRRTSSMAAHPTTQGVSLRGIGPSAASRTLVLLDGVPLNDPFGGWVSWARVPVDSIDRVEVIEGATSNLYGNYAMGGVISLDTRPAAPRTVQVSAAYGNRQTPKLDVRASHLWGPVGLSVDASVFETAGYQTVAANERGPIDDPTSVGVANVSTRLTYAVNDRVRASFGLGHFRERRDNGKHTTFGPRVDERNATDLTSASAGVRLNLPDLSDVQAAVFVDDESFQTNSIAVVDAVHRTSARLGFDHVVPSRGWGGVLQWARPITTVHLLTGGGDWRIVRGESREQVFDEATGLVAVSDRLAGGRQRSAGLYFQDLITPTTRVTVTLSARLDRFRTSDGHATETDLLTGLATAGSRSSVPARAEVVASPRAALLYHVNERWSVWGALAAGFRAPTLNELYRGFRVGTRQVLANPDLGPERMTGGEAGVTVAVANAVVARATVFDTRLRNPVSTVTVSQDGASVILRRQNIGRTRARGLEVDVDVRPASPWHVSAAYAFSASTVVAYDAPVTEPDDLDASLVGKAVPQVPRHRGSVTVSYTSPRGHVAATLDAASTQFDDDRNVAGVPGRSQAGLPGYAVVNVRATKKVSADFDVFIGMQNLLNHEYFVATLPTLVGMPRTVQAGVRVMLRGR